MGLKEVQGSWRVAAEVNYFCGFYDCPPVVEKDYSVGFQMAVEANPGSTESVAVWAVFGGGGAVFGVGLSFLRCLFAFIALRRPFSLLRLSPKTDIQ